MKIKVSQAVRDYMSALGTKGATSAAKGRTKEERSALARKAVLARWSRVKKEKAVEP